MKIYKVFVQKTLEASTLLIANSDKEAMAIAEKIAEDDELEFDDFGAMIDAVSCNHEEITDKLIKEIKNFGVYDFASKEYEFDISVIEKLEETQRQEAIERNLKENHGVFDFMKDKKNNSS